MAQWCVPKIKMGIGDSMPRRARVARLEVVSSRMTPVGTAKVIVPNQRGAWDQDLARGIGSTITLSWTGTGGGDLSTIFSGTITKIKEQTEGNIAIEAVNAGVQLVDTKVTRTYQRESATGIVSHLMRGLDFSALHIAQFTDRIRRLPLRANNIAEALGLLCRRLSISIPSPWCDPDRALRWEEYEKTLDADYLFESGKNIIDFLPVQDAPYKWQLLSFAGEAVRPGQTVSVISSDGTQYYCRVDEVRHTLGIDGTGMRTGLLLYVWREIPPPDFEDFLELDGSASTRA